MSKSSITYLTSYYSDVPGTCPASDPYCNPILSIASLRNYTDAPVIVYDYGRDNDWKQYPQALNFTVVPAVVYDFHHGLDLLKRIMFTRQIMCLRAAALHPGKYVHMDTDMFWTGCVAEDWDFSTLRMYRNDLYCNNGCFTFGGNYQSFSLLSQVVGGCLMADRPGIREQVAKVTKLEYYNDEAMTCYLLHSGQLGIPAEHFPYNGMMNLDDLEGQQNIHFMQGCMPQPIRSNRVLYALLLKEINHGAVNEFFPKIEPMMTFQESKSPEFFGSFRGLMQTHMTGGRLNV